MLPVCLASAEEVQVQSWGSGTGLGGEVFLSSLTQPSSLLCWHQERMSLLQDE